MSRFSPTIARLTAIAIAMVGAWPVASHADGLYKCREKNGVVAYTNKPQAYKNCTLLTHYLSFSQKAKPKSGRSRVAVDRPISTLVIGGVVSTAPVVATSATTKRPISTLVGGGVASTALVGTESPAASRSISTLVIGGVTSTAPMVAAAWSSAPLTPAPLPSLPSSPIILPKRAPVTRLSQGWVYEDSAHAAQRPDFSTITAGVESSAAALAPPTSIIPQPSSSLARSIAAMAAVGQTVQKVTRGSVYRIKRRDGITEYTNVKPRGGPFAVLFTYIATCVACDVHSKINFASTALHLDQYDAEIAAAATDFGVDMALLRAVIHAESAFNPMALSNKGAQGLMQLMPATAGELGVTNAFDVAQNIRGGARYLAILLHDFNGNTQLATAAYNAGANAVLKYGGVPPYDETQVYVQRVETLRNRYRQALLAANDSQRVHTL